MDIFTAIYFVALVAEILIRATIAKKRRQGKIREGLVTNHMN